MTVDEFLAGRAELPDGGRWTELVAGEPVSLDPPDQRHGDILLQLSKAVATVLRPETPTFVLFDEGVQTTRQPDTLRFPAMSLFVGGTRFERLDQPAPLTVPKLVVEIASQNDRRRGMAGRVWEYQTAGVQVVWVVDPQESTVTAIDTRLPLETFTQADTLTQTDLLPGLSLPLTTLFAEPAWWQGKR